MGMYCCCGTKIGKDEEWCERCQCDWKGWISVYDWPLPRKNKELPFALPEKEGVYKVRYQTSAGDHVETESEYQKKPRADKCGYTGVDVLLHWSGDDEEQPYAWANL